MAKEKPKRGRPSEFDRLLAQLRESTRPTPAAEAAFQAIKTILRPFEGEVLKAKAQARVPSYLLSAPARSAYAGWEFARLEAETRSVYLTLPPLNQDCALRARLGRALQRCPRRWDARLTLTKVTAKLLAEIGELVPACYEWFLREVVAGQAQFAATPLDDYTLWPDDAAEDSAPEINLEYPVPTSSPVPAALLPRLGEAYGSGLWQQYNVVVKVQLPGWSGQAWEVEVHHYSRKKERAFVRAVQGAAEDWKIKRFRQAPYPEQAVKASLVYAARANFRASLVAGKVYPCSATIGLKFNSYVRIVDESGEEYWYPVRFFIGHNQPLQQTGRA